MRRCILLALIAAACLAGPASAQGTPADLNAELAAMRDGGALEARGDLKGAEGITRAVLEKNPRALTSLITLERLLTMQGRLLDITRLHSPPTSIPSSVTRCACVSMRRWTGLRT